VAADLLEVLHGGTGIRSGDAVILIRND
jgi:hypothetical protein